MSASVVVRSLTQIESVDINLPSRRDCQRQELQILRLFPRNVCCIRELWLLIGRRHCFVVKMILYYDNFEKGELGQEDNEIDGVQTDT